MAAQPALAASGGGLAAGATPPRILPMEISFFR
jgi:hypothetical protein